MKPLPLLLLIVMNCLWAATLSTFKVLSPWLDAGGIVTWRYGMASLVCAVFWFWLPGKAPRGWDLVKVAVIGALVFCLGPRMQTAGVQMGDAGDAAMLMAFEPLLCAVAAALVLREHIAPRRWIGFAFGISGVLLISKAWTSGFHWSQLAANGLVLASLLAETAYSILGKPLLKRAGPLKVMAVALFAGTLLNLALDGPEVVPQALTFNTQAWGLLLYLTIVCTLFGYGLWIIVIREVPVNIVVLTIFVQPAAGLIIAMIWLHEKPHWGQLWGVLAIVAGLAVGLWDTARRAESRDGRRPSEVRIDG